MEIEEEAQGSNKQLPLHHAQQQQRAAPMFFHTRAVEWVHSIH